MQYHDGKKLPPGWVKCASTKYGRDYFFDTQTGQSVWFPPGDAATTSGGAAAAATVTAPQPPMPPPSGQVDDETESFSPPVKRARQQGPSTPPGSNGNSGSGTQGGTKVAVIVPYRDLDPAQRRSAHLEQFVPYMEDFLGRAVARGAAEGAVGGFRVYVVEQSADDGLKFNRGKLLNIGFDLARREGCGAFLLHDVDLLPSDELAR